MRVFTTDQLDEKQLKELFDIEEKLGIQFEVTLEGFEGSLAELVDCIESGNIDCGSCAGTGHGNTYGTATSQTCDSCKGKGILPFCLERYY